MTDRNLAHTITFTMLFLLTLFGLAVISAGIYFIIQGRIVFGIISIITGIALSYKGIMTAIGGIVLHHRGEL